MRLVYIDGKLKLSLIEEEMKAITKEGWPNTYCHEVIINGRLEYRSWWQDKAILSCGARVVIETAWI